MVKTSDLLREKGFFFPINSSLLYTSDGMESSIKAIINDNTKEIVGYVSPKYTPVSNEQAFDFVDELEGITIESFGSRWTGHSYIIGSFPTVNILGDDHNVNIILENSFDGSTPVRATYCMLRMVCSNQLSTVWSENPQLVRLTHTKSITSRIEDAKNVMKGVQDYISNYVKYAEELSQVALDNNKIRSILNQYLRLEESESERQTNKIIEVRNQIEANLSLEDHENFKNTGWGLVNSVTNYNSHYKPSRRTKENWETKRYFRNAQGSLMNLANLISRAA